MALSPRLLAAADALDVRPGMRILEIGCGPGALARELAVRVGPTGAVLGVDRSATAIAQATAQVPAELAGRLTFRFSAADTFRLVPGEPPYDVAVALRVGALDGRHPALQAASLTAIAAALTPGGRLWIDGGDPLRALALDEEDR